jgi:hypothetical protein
MLTCWYRHLPIYHSTLCIEGQYWLLVANLNYTGTKERTNAEWVQLVDSAGLKVREVLKYDEEYEDCIIIAVLA